MACTGVLGRGCLALEPCAPWLKLPLLGQGSGSWCSRAASSSAPQDAPVPSEIRLHKAKKVLELSYVDGGRFRFSSELLRVLSPSADSRRTDARGAISRVVSGRRHVGIMGVEPVGNYAIRIKFDDLHDSGIYSWKYLHDLGSHKFSRAKQYIRSLRALGLSRNPPPPRAKLAPAPAPRPRAVAGGRPEGEPSRD